MSIVCFLLLFNVINVSHIYSAVFLVLMWSVPCIRAKCFIISFLVKLLKNYEVDKLISVKCNKVDRVHPESMQIC